MGAAAARVLLDPEPRPDDLVGLSPIPEDRLGIECAGAVEHQQEALLVFEGGRVGAEAIPRQHRRESPLRAVCPTCSGLVIVPKFALIPDASDAAMASACAVRVLSRPIR